MALVISAKAASAALPFSFSPDTARAKFADHRASLIRSVSEKSAQAISETAARASGNRPTEQNVTSPALQVRDVIGLTPAQARSLDTFRAVLERTAAVKLRPVPLTTDLLRHLPAPQRAIVQRAASGDLSPEKVTAIVERHRKALVEQIGRASRRESVCQYV